jgi:hypothetical protein
MKELSIEQKAKRYDEAKYIMKEYLESGNAGIIAENTIKKAFPELAESENERIKRIIKSALKTYFEGNLSVNTNDTDYAECLTWLEKQGSEESIDQDTLIQQRVDALADIVAEQKPADKVEPKFREGDWIVISSDNEKIVHIVSIEYFPSGQPKYITSEGKWYGNGIKAHLWNITQDAKDGDVLATDDGNIFVFDGTVEEDKYPFAYYGLTRHRFESYDRRLPFTHNNVHPATKEQRDQLEKAMADAGYRWNLDEKKMEKIEQKPRSVMDNYYGLR